MALKLYFLIMLTSKVVEDEKLCFLFEKCGCLDGIEQLQHHKNEQIQA